MSLWCRSRFKQRKAGEALRHECRMALPNAANLNLSRIPKATGLESAAAALFDATRASGPRWSQAALLQPILISAICSFLSADGITSSNAAECIGVNLSLFLGNIEDSTTSSRRSYVARRRGCQTIFSLVDAYGLRLTG